VNTNRSADIQRLYPKTLSQFADRIEFAAKSVGRKGVMELERLTTALYVREKESKKGVQLSIEDTAQKMMELKPHISRPEAIGAVNEINRLCEETRGLEA